MASFVYDQYKKQLADGTYKWHATPATSASMKVALVNTTRAASTSGDNTVQDVLGSASPPEREYGTARVALSGSGLQVDEDGTTTRLKGPTAGTEFSALAADGTEQVTSVLVYVDPTGSAADSACHPVAILELATAFYGNDSDVTFQWSSNGIITLT